jgi:hypothetical protein
MRKAEGQSAFSKNAPSLHEAMLLAAKRREIKLQNGYGYTINLSADVALESYHRHALDSPR